MKRDRARLIALQRRVGREALRISHQRTPDTDSRGSLAMILSCPQAHPPTSRTTSRSLRQLSRPEHHKPLPGEVVSIEVSDRPNHRISRIRRVIPRLAQRVSRDGRACNVDSVQQHLEHGTLIRLGAHVRLTQEHEVRMVKGRDQVTAAVALPAGAAQGRTVHRDGPPAPGQSSAHSAIAVNERAAASTARTARPEIIASWCRTSRSTPRVSDSGSDEQTLARRGVTGATPCESAIRRVLQRLDADAFDDLAGGWAQARPGSSERRWPGGRWQGR